MTAGPAARGRIRRFALALAIVAPLSTALPADAAVGRSDGFVVERSDGRPGAVTGRLVVEKVRSPAFVMIAASEGGKWTSILGYSFEDQRNWPGVYGLPTGVPACPVAPACAEEAGVRLNVNLAMTNGGKLNAVYVGGLNVRLRLAIPGPRVRLRKFANGFAYAPADRSDAIGVTASGHRVERFTRAEVPGGSRGSVAYAHLPCFRGDVPLLISDPVSGAGSAVLRGSSLGERTVVCTSGERAMTSAYQPARATRWELKGDVVGVGDTDVRLAVLSVG